MNPILEFMAGGWKDMLGEPNVNDIEAEEIDPDDGDEERVNADGSEEKENPKDD